MPTTGPAAVGRAAPTLTTAQVWRALTKASFAVLSHVTPAGEPRSSGVLYAVADHRLYVAVAPESWKARHIAADGHVAVTVPVRRGGILAVLFPIPPAAVSFRGTALVHPPGAGRDLPAQLSAVLPAELRSSTAVIEIRPAGEFVTYGLGVSLRQMRDPALARNRVPVD
ncbi:pyridoxamine 5'-phosphate oxidase family protein [Actinoplanes sp. NPDC049599]|uniref:pyridoxamine 5'-phosphate oxidase family protein n=1 Tax=Actinoplanes sp. NPDC049599 TaxID=3363903 RepID=UPI00379C03E5